MPAAASRPTNPHSRLHPWTVAGVLTTVGVSLVIGITVAAESTRSGNEDNPLAYTGALSSMNLPVIKTPGEASGTVDAAGVVVDGATWALGDVPLDTAVLPTWVLRNTGTQPVTIGEPHPEVRAGCCPGPFAVDRRVIQPGEEATMTFELAMHAGMDGWHEIAVHVPVTIGDTEQTLDLAVTGNFGDHGPPGRNRP
jgi:hypothetical protein